MGILKYLTLQPSSLTSSHTSLGVLILCSSTANHVGMRVPGDTSSWKRSKPPYRLASSRMSSLRRRSMSSRFDARSDRVRVWKGLEASRRT